MSYEHGTFFQAEHKLRPFSLFDLMSSNDKKNFTYFGRASRERYSSVYIHLLRVAFNDQAIEFEGKELSQEGSDQ